MKISELLVEEKVEELGATPMGLGSRILQKAASFVPGQFGAKAGAKLDVGKRANELSKTFIQWALRSGIGGPSGQLNAVPVTAIKQFLKQQSLPPPNFSQSVYDLTKQDQNNRVWTAVAQASYRSAGSTAGGSPLGQQYGVQPGPGGGGGGGNSVNQLISALGSMSLTPNQKARLQNLLAGTPE